MDDKDGLERIIEGLRLDLYEGTAVQLSKAIENAIRTMWWAESVKVCGKIVMQEAVRSVIKSLTINHIDFIIGKLENRDPDDPITNGQGYLISCIYNAPADYAANSTRESRR